MSWMTIAACAMYGTSQWHIGTRQITAAFKRLSKLLFAQAVTDFSDI